MCAWAACDRPAVKVVETWPMCTAHVRKHYELEKPTTPTQITPSQRAEVIRELNGEGWPDAAIAKLFGCATSTVRVQRVRMGLSRVAKRVGPVPMPIWHGSEGGAAAHRRRGERPCGLCRDAESAARWVRRQREAS